MKRKYNKQHCDSKVRATIKFGSTTISLVGTHAFEWSIIKEEPNKIVITTFKNRSEAKKEYDMFTSFIKDAIRRNEIIEERKRLQSYIDKQEEYVNDLENAICK